MYAKSFAPHLMKNSILIRCILALVVLSLLTACGGEKLPEMPAVPDTIKELPGAQAILDELPAALEDLPNALEELGLPDLSQIAGIPQLDDLPAMQAPPGGIIFNGPTEFRLVPGETIPGTDIRLTAVTDEGAEFSISGQRSLRVIGDSLDFDGNWPGLDGSFYNLRSRIYRVGNDSIRAGGVHQLTIDRIAPQEGTLVPAESTGAHTSRFLYSSAAGLGEQFSGMTLGYAGADDRGAKLSGLPPDTYAYRKVGDSIAWQGTLRQDIAVAYAARMLLYGENSARIGGIVKVSLPNN